MWGDALQELWKPDTAGSIVPFSGGANAEAKTQVTHFHFHGVTDADSFKKSQAQMSADMLAVMASAHRRNR